MGCVSSKPDINDQHPNIFQVTNVNDQGELISPGQLEVTETELVLHQRGKPPTIWPLRSLRKYGFDSEIFSFECGRRSPTGEGIYAFRCRKAEQLFNIIHQHIARNSTEENNTLGLNIQDFPITSNSGPPVSRRNPQNENYLNPAPSIRPHPVLSRPGSIASNGPVSPTLISPPPPQVTTPVELEHNNNKRGSVEDHSYSNMNNIPDIETLQSPNYANLSGSNENSSHLYMNTTIASQVEVEEQNVGHCYANIDTKDLEMLRPDFSSSSSAPQTPTSLYVTIHEVNYAELDLDVGKNLQQINQVSPESPGKSKKSYATIDFQRTNALSQSINSRMEVEEGSRKTRHNSTISDVTNNTRHSNSLSD